MERLRERLESVQDRLLDLYEKDSTLLSDQILHWKLVREENALLHAAKNQGVSRIGLVTVPPRVVTEARAKDAIQLQLVLESLSKSAFANEPWTLADTSKEAWINPPGYCFQKGGSTVTLVFDQNPDNANEYTAWSFIYYQGENDEWFKAPGYVDVKGAYFFEDGIKRYYLDFETEAARFSDSGEWEVNYKNKVFSSVTSTSEDTAGVSPQGGDRQEETRGFSGPVSSTISTPPRPPQARPRRTPTRGVRGRQRRRGGRPRSGPRAPEREAPPTPAEVGTRSRTVGRGATSRLDRLLQEAKDPPILVIRGGPNHLKCYRFRLNQKFKPFFSSISSTFKWLNVKGSDPKLSRVLISFDSAVQRQSFLNSVPIPRSFSYSQGSLDAL
uniref:Regulatory protein E2 n=1 Tax=Firstpapillomavirinae sp. TaxID=2809408 RepID=A0AA51GGW0_9PAPI|nr:E2 protein [Firstpapillomavirinae sp.]